MPAPTPHPPSPGRRLGLDDGAFLARLRALDRRFSRGFLDTDPVGLVRRYDAPGDREIAGLLAAGLAYGRVASIRASLTRLLDALGPSPSRFVDRFDLRRDGRRLERFRHRFTTGRDVAILLDRVRRARESAGSLEGFFLAGDPDPEGETLEGAMNAFALRLFDVGSAPRGGDEGARWLFPVPAGGSACKRSCLFLRWMVRPDDGVDCGVWRGLPPRRLVVPLDTHLLRIAGALGWSRRRSPGWRMALEVTACLRRLDPDDPVRFDFALSRLGILGEMPRLFAGAS